MKAKKYTKEQDEFIRKHQEGISRQELTDMFNAHFNDNRTLTAIRTYCKKRGLKRLNSIGAKAWNSGTKGVMKANHGCFKKGHTPHNHRPVGSERVCSKDGYILVKTKEPNAYEAKHRIEWRKHRGEIPQDYCIRFLDGDPTNYHINNLEAIPRSAHATSNKANKANTGDPELNRAILLTETLKHEIRKLHGR